MTATSTRTDPASQKPEERSIALAIPAYNEADGIAGFLTDLDEALADLVDRHWIVVVDDRSTDNTAEVLEKVRPTLSGELIALTNEENRGHGPTVLRAYRRAIATGATWIVQVDGDGQFEAADIELLLRHAEAGARIVTGRRTMRFDPWFRRGVTSALPHVLRVGFGVRRRDVNCPFRLYRADVLPPILDAVPPDSLAPHVLMTVLEARSGHRCVEVPVRHRPRRGDTEVGTTWQQGRTVLIPKKLVLFLGEALQQLIEFRRSL